MYVYKHKINSITSAFEQPISQCDHSDIVVHTNNILCGLLLLTHANDITKYK